MTEDWADLDARARAVLAAQGGIAHVSAFDAAGISRNQVGALLGRGVLERPRKGWYVDPDLPWQVKHAVRVGGIAACASAAALWDLPVPPDEARRVHVHVDAHDTRLRHHRDKNWVLASVDDDRELVLHRGRCHDRRVSGRTSLVDTLLMLINCVPNDWFIAALDAALHAPRDGAPLLSAADVARFSALLPRRKRFVLNQADALAESCLETLLRLGMLRRGITDLVLQAVPHPAYRVDFLVRGRLIIEADGAGFHDPERDRVRDAVLHALGYRILRFSYERIVHDLEQVLDEIEEAISALR